MHTARHIAVDLMRALGVLALVFLSFSQVHGSGDAAHGVLTLAVNHSFCGDAIPPPADKDHAPCHACRFDPVALPTATGGLIRAPQSTTLEFADAPSTCLLRTATGLPSARGPPRLA